MKKYFYTHLVETTSSLTLALAELDMSKEDRLHLLKLIEDNLHHEILDLILSELSEDDKKTFLEHYTSNNHTKIWEFLNAKIEKIEDKIKKVAEDLKKEMHDDILQSLPTDDDTIEK